MINSIMNSLKHPRKPRTEYRQNGTLHRDDGPAIESEDYQEYRVLGRLHRIGGPAIVDSTMNVEEWWFHDKRHRNNGPAVRRGLFLEYWITGHRLSEVEFYLRKETTLEDLDKLIFKAINKRDRKLIYRKAIELGSTKEKARNLSEQTPPGQVISWKKQEF